MGPRSDPITVMPMPRTVVQATPRLLQPSHVAVRWADMHSRLGSQPSGMC